MKNLISTDLLSKGRVADQIPDPDSTLEKKKSVQNPTLEKQPGSDLIKFRITFYIIYIIQYIIP